MPNQPSRIITCVLLMFAIGYACFLASDFIKKAAPAITAFWSAGGDHTELLDRKVSYSRPVHEAAALIPAGEIVDISKGAGLHTIDFIAMHYALYPALSGEPWNYFLDLNGQVIEAPASWTMKPLSNGAKLYAKPGYGFSPPPFDHRSKISEFFIFLLVSLFVVVVGTGFLKGIGIGPGLLGKSWFLGTAYLAGFTVLNWVFWCCLMMSIPLDAVTLLLVSAAVLVCAMIFRRAGSRVGDSALDDQIDIGQADIPHPGWIRGTIGMILWLLVGMIALTSVCIPVTVWDELLIWVYKSKMLFYDGAIDFSILAPSHVYYPLLWPLHIHTFFKTAGGCFSETLKWVSASVFLVYVSQLYGAGVFLAFKRTGARIMVVFCLLAFMNFILLTALPENIFFALSLGMVIAMMLWLKEGHHPRFIILAWVMAMGLSGIKFEGGLIIACLTLCLAMAGRSAGLTFRQMAPLAWFIVPCLVPWMWTGWLKEHGYTYSIYHFSNPLVWENVRLVTAAVMHSLSQSKNLVLIMVMSGAVLYANNRLPLNPVERFLSLVAVVLVGFTVGSVLFWPTDDIRLYYPEVLDRLFLRATPFLALLCAGRVMNSKRFEQFKSGREADGDHGKTNEHAG